MPVLAVARRLQCELRVNVRSVSETARLIIGEIDLDSANRVDAAEIDRQRLAWFVLRRDPERLRVFVGYPPNSEFA